MFGIFKKKGHKKPENTTKKQDESTLKTDNGLQSDVDKTLDDLSIEISNAQDIEYDIVSTTETIEEDDLSDIPAESITNETIPTHLTNSASIGSEGNIDSVIVTVTDESKQEEEKEEKVVSAKDSWAFRLKKGLAKSRDKFNKSMASMVGGGQINEELYEDLETVLLTSDMGIEATELLLKEVRERVSFKGLKDANELKLALKEALFDLILPLEDPLEITRDKPFVIMMVGVNGAGKTTTIGKLTHHFQNNGKEIILAAGDTFRAAAREQLLAWGKRNNVTVIAQKKGDSAAVCYDAIEAAKARNKDIVLADTAGRLPTQLNLMEEIKKVKRVIQKSIPEAPHEIILVLDANIGQNTINQVKAFDDALGLTGLIVTKLDGTAKGGVVAALAKNHPIPIRYIGVGESIEDLKPFRAKEFVDAFFDE